MKSFWKNKNVLITGINGFVGGNLAKHLLKEEANVFGLIRNNTEELISMYKSYLINKILGQKQELRRFSSIFYDLILNKNDISTNHKYNN